MIGISMSWVRWKALAGMNKMIFGSSRLACLLQNRFSGYKISNGIPRKAILQNGRSRTQTEYG
jgi:hypothetical protein